MDTDEWAVYYYLKPRKTEFVSEREISLRAGGRRRFQAEPDWGYSTLMRMLERGIIESGEPGRYRLKAMPKQDTKGKRLVTPAILELLAKKGKVFADVMTIEDEDAYYGRL